MRFAANRKKGTASRRNELYDFHISLINRIGDSLSSRTAMGTQASPSANETGITAPHWVRLERDAAGNFTASHSTNGSSWQAVAGSIPTNIPMDGTIFVGLAVTSHAATATTEARFSNVTITGNAGTQWASQDVGILV